MTGQGGLSLYWADGRGLGKPWLRLSRLVLTLFCLVGWGAGAASAATVAGERKQWHDIQLSFAGPRTSETAQSNPFLDYRLNVTFTQGSRRHVVPGYFAADGNAANSGATEGNVWRVHFVPDAVGTWTWKASFRTGPNVAVSADADAGSGTAFDGESGSFNVAPTDKTGRDHRAHGMLRYAGKHFLRYSGSGKYFVMAGTQSPENFLAYYEFDNTRDYRGQKGLPYPDQLHHYDPHLKDWRPGDPTWQGGKGKAIIGALNYLAGKGMNAFYTLTMNNYGDAMDTNPWIHYDAHTRYDISKLAQWEIVFSHMDRLGMQVMLITQEEEGEQTLGKLGVERKLYYRELIARFAHHHGIIWDLDEEMDRFRYFTTQDIKDIADYIKALDPYDHPIQYVQWKAELIADDKTYGRLLGFPNFDATALQHDAENTHAETIKWLDKSRAAGHPWLVHLIEMNPGVRTDAEDYWHDRVRKLGSGVITWPAAPARCSSSPIRSATSTWRIIAAGITCSISFATPMSSSPPISPSRRCGMPTISPRRRTIMCWPSPARPMPSICPRAARRRST